MNTKQIIKYDNIIKQEIIDEKSKYRIPVAFKEWLEKTKSRMY